MTLGTPRPSEAPPVPNQSLWDVPSPPAPVTPQGRVKSHLQFVPLPEHRELLPKGTVLQFGGLEWCQSLAGPRWPCHSTSDTAWVPHSWTGNMGKGLWGRAPGVLQEILQCPGGTEEGRIHMEFPLSIPRNGCSQLPCPASASCVPAQQENTPRVRPGGSDPSAGPLWGQALLAQPPGPKSSQGSAQPGISLRGSVAALATADPSVTTPRALIHLPEPDLEVLWKGEEGYCSLPHPARILAGEGACAGRGTLGVGFQHERHFLPLLHLPKLLGSFKTSLLSSSLASM